MAPQRRHGPSIKLRQSTSLPLLRNHRLRHRDSRWLHLQVMHARHHTTVHDPRTTPRLTRANPEPAGGNSRCTAVHLEGSYERQRIPIRSTAQPPTSTTADRIAAEKASWQQHRFREPAVRAFHPGDTARPIQNLESQKRQVALRTRIAPCPGRQDTVAARCWNTTSSAPSTLAFIPTQQFCRVTKLPNTMDTHLQQPALHNPGSYAATHSAGRLHLSPHGNLIALLRLSQSNKSCTHTTVQDMPSS